jgi:hypothetical protein
MPGWSYVVEVTWVTVEVHDASEETKIGEEKAGD